MSTVASQIPGISIVFFQLFVQAQIKENIKTLRHWPLWGNPPVSGGFPSQRASYAENVSIWWRLVSSCFVICNVYIMYMQCNDGAVFIFATSRHMQLRQCPPSRSQDERNIVNHYDDVIMTMLASHITSLTVVYSIVYSGVIQRKHQSSASLAFVREIHRGPVNFPHKWPVTRKMFPFDDVIMLYSIQPKI